MSAVLSRPARGGQAGIAVTLDRVGKSFGAHAVLSQLSLAVPAGQFLAIVGRSGSGKSTVLRLLCGLEEPDGGAILFDGRPAQPGMARIMFQEPRLLPWASLEDNVVVGLSQAAARGDGRALALAPCGPWASRVARGTGPRSSRAGRSSAWRWPAPWSAGPACCCSTSRSAPSTR